MSSTFAGVTGSTPATEAGGERGPAWPHRHLLDTDVLTWPQIELLLDTADVMVEIVVNGDAMLAQIERIPIVIGGSPASPSH